MGDTPETQKPADAEGARADIAGMIDAAEPLEPFGEGPGHSPSQDDEKAAHEPPQANGGASRRARTPQRDGLMTLTAVCDLWHTPDGRVYATFPVRGHKESWPVRSETFKRWLSHRAWGETGQVPGDRILEDTVRVLEARAIEEGREREPWLRVGSKSGCLYIDLGDSDWRAVEVRPDGWRVIERHGLPFVRSAGMRPLPVPEPGYEIAELRRFVNVESEADFTLVVAWLMAALRGRGPYPIIVVNGQQGSGKSTFSRVIRSLVDPNAAPIRSAPKDERDLVVAAQNAHVLAMDNLSHLPPDLADGLCRLSTGGGFSTRKLHTDSDENLFYGQRPVILNGIPSLTDRPDLADRAINIRLKSIPEDERLPEDEFWSDWDAAAPKVFGALLDGLSAALRRVHTIKLERSPRLADFAKWATAAEPGLGWQDGDFMAAYGANRRDVADGAFEANPVAVAVHAMMQESVCADGWRGTPSELLEALNDRVPEALKRSRSWPQTPQGIGNAMDRVAPLLAQRGVLMERKRSGLRFIILTHKRGG